jgi:hypothetical protein
MSCLKSLALALSVTLPAAAVAGPTLLANGSFEQVQLGAGQWTVVPSLAGWSVDATSGVEVRNQVVGSAQDGGVFVELDTHSGAIGSSNFDGSTNSWISQQVQTVAGMHYTLTWFYAPRAGEAADTNPIEVMWNGGKVAKSNGSGMGHNANVWQQFTADLIGTGGLDTVRFAAVGKADSLGGSLDNVTLVANAQAPAAVSEPATLALSLAALGAIGIGLRRRRAA